MSLNGEHERSIEGQNSLYTCIDSPRKYDTYSFQQLNTEKEKEPNKHAVSESRHMLERHSLYLLPVLGDSPLATLRDFPSVARSTVTMISPLSRTVHASRCAGEPPAVAMSTIE
jgi:hypothetical protein